MEKVLAIITDFRVDPLLQSSTESLLDIFAHYNLPLEADSQLSLSSVTQTLLCQDFDKGLKRLLCEHYDQLEAARLGVSFIACLDSRAYRLLLMGRDFTYSLAALHQDLAHIAHYILEMPCYPTCSLIYSAMDSHAELTAFEHFQRAYGLDKKNAYLTYCNQGELLKRGLAPRASILPPAIRGVVFKPAIRSKPPLHPFSSSSLTDEAESQSQPKSLPHPGPKLYSVLHRKRPRRSAFQDVAEEEELDQISQSPSPNKPAARQQHQQQLMAEEQPTAEMQQPGPEHDEQQDPFE